MWSEGGCDSWYLDDDGVNRALWPGFSFEYWARTRRARRADCTVVAAQTLSRRHRLRRPDQVPASLLRPE